MTKALRIILVVVLFVVFFEVGLFSSYTIVASEAPDIQGLIDMQISKITGIFNSENVNNALVKDPTAVNISNKMDVAKSLEDLSKVDGVNVDSMNVTTYDDTDNKELNITIEALGYASPSSNSSQIVISQDPSYKIVAEGNATYKNGELVVDADSITIQSILKLYWDGYMINVIGIGQNRENMTLGAIRAIEESDVIVGYKKYVAQISDLISDKEIIKKGMGDEIARAELAIDKSLSGQTVSLISSGDPGVFGMANVLYQIISKYDEEIEVKIYPGVSAANYAANKLGAPLNDYANISLSNILTPLSEIEKKLEFALKANLIIAIYNPISKTRKEPFRRFVECVLRIKGEDALIGIVDSTYEPVKETIVKIKDLTEDMVNMSCTLIVGNDLTYVQEDKLVTPRGYVIKSKIHPLSYNHYEKFLNGEIPHGPNRECEFYPCHYDGQYCDFCYCPFYPCGDSSTGGQWIKGKNVWNCKDCLWVHEEEAVNCIRKPLEEILEEPDDLKAKKKTLLKLRRACLLKNNPFDL